VRLVVDSTPPVGESVCSDRAGRRFSSLVDFAPARPGKGSTASRDLYSRGCAKLGDAGGTIHLLELQLYGKAWNR
jgi:hypothetical protein